MSDGWWAGKTVLGTEVERRLGLRIRVSSGKTLVPRVYSEVARQLLFVVACRLLWADLGRLLHMTVELIDLRGELHRAVPRR